MKYMVVLEQGPTSCGAYVPDLPGCIAVGKSQNEVLKLEGKHIPVPRSSSAYVEVHA